MLELDFDRMEIRHNGTVVADVLGNWAYNKTEAEELAKQSAALGRKLTEQEQTDTLYRLHFQ